MFKKSKVIGFLIGSITLVLLLTSGATYAHMKKKEIKVAYNNIKIVADGNQITPNKPQAGDPKSSAQSKVGSITTTLTENSIKTSELETFNYLLYTPENASANMPLIVYLHGGHYKGDNLDDLDVLTTTDGFPQYLNDGELGSIPAYIVIPQMPSSYNAWADIKVSVKELINSVSETYKIDSKKISLTGHSMGGTGTWNIALSYPDLFSCIAPMSGRITNNQSNINTLPKMPVWAFVGSNDTTVPPSLSIDFINSLKAKNSNAQITVYDGATHSGVPKLAYLDKNVNIVNWLISNSK